MSARLTPSNHASPSVYAAPSSQLVGIEWLRAILSVGVVAWHTGGADATGIHDKTVFALSPLTWGAVVGLYGCLLAVPLFVLISTYLYCLKGPTSAHLWKRLGRLGYLLAFWPLAIIVWDAGRSGVIAKLPDSLESAVTLFLTGGHTLFYFFVSLMFALAACRVAAKWHDFTLLLGLVVSTAALGFAAKYAHSIGLPWMALNWSPLNFLPYSFAALLLARHDVFLFGSRALLIFFAAIALGVGLAAWEWTFLRDVSHFGDMGIALPAYTRPALVPLAIAAFVGAVHYLRASNPAIHFMSERSLALYCLHMFLLAQMMAAFKAIGLASSDWRLLHIVSLVMLSYAASLVLERFLNRKLLF